MNKTTVKRGIGAVLLALVAAGLLAFLLKDKADQRQDIVDMPLPGSDNSTQALDGTAKLPQLSMDNTSSINVDGSVIASAGADRATNAEGVLDSTTGAIAASATAVGAGVAGAVSEVTSAGEKALDFNVRPPTVKSSEFRDLSDVDLVNNGEEAKATSTAAKVASTSSASSKPATTTRPSNTTKGSVIASSSANGGSEARLIDERKSTPPRSARTERVVSSKPASSNSRPASSSNKPTPAPVPAAATSSSAATSPTGYAIQLLATSSTSRAQSLVNVMKAEGYDAYSTKVTQNGKLLYRVRIGRYSSKSAATKVQEAMKRRYKKNADVNRSAVVSR